MNKTCKLTIPLFLPLLPLIPSLVSPAIGGYVPIYGSPITGGYVSGPTRATSTGTAANTAITSIHEAFIWSPTSANQLAPFQYDGFLFSNFTVAFMNESGTLVGFAASYDADNNYLGASPARWDPGSSTPTVMAYAGSFGSGTFPLYQSNVFLYGINSSGAVAGMFDDYTTGTDLGYRGFRWDPGTATPTVLGMVDAYNYGMSYTYAEGINNSGTVVGTSGTFDVNGNITQTAAKWDAGSATAIALTAPAGLNNGNALAINDAGTTAGYAGKYDSNGNFVGWRPVRWNPDGTPIQLGDLTEGNAGSAVATLINQRGTIVGRSNVYDASGSRIGFRGVMWLNNSVVPITLSIFDIPDVSLPESQVKDLNNADIVVGEVDGNDSNNNLVERAAYWTPDGSVFDLNNLIDPNSGWVLNVATSINDQGWITGVGTFDPDGPGGNAPIQDAFLLQFPQLAVPAPEPDTISLLALVTFPVLFKRHSKT